MIGMMAVLAPIYAAVIAILIYFAIRVFVGRRRKQMKMAVGEGICATCGEKIAEDKCQNCDKSQESKDNSQPQV